ncbi:SHOCT domain-containing protein [Halosimplex sp. J119]
MALWKLLKYTALAVFALFLVSVVLSTVFALVGFVWAIVTTVVTLLVLGGLLYGGFRLFSLLSDEDSADTNPFGSDTGSTRSADTGEDRISRLRERYASGEISEAELERRLELELDGVEPDSIDRELNREKS